MFIKTSLPKSLLSSAFHQFRHSNLQTSSTILDFRSKIHYYENNYSRMLPPTNNLEKMSPSDISANRIASVFLGNPSQMELNRGKKGENQNLQVKERTCFLICIVFYNDYLFFVYLLVNNYCKLSYLIFFLDIGSIFLIFI